MAIISDGSTNVTIPYVNEIADPEMITANKLSGSGAIKGQTSGERFKLKCDCRTTSTIFRNLLDLLKNGQDTYYYTANDSHGIYSGITYPLECRIELKSNKWDNRGTYYFSFSVESVDYI